MFDPFLTVKQILKKLGGDRDFKKVSILDVSLAEDAETPGFTVYRDLSDVTPFELGKTYTVHLDSGSYECVAKAMDGIGNVLGNTAFGGGADTGETFLVAITGGIAMVMDASCGTKASVTANVETIVPIDQKYLPGVCLPVVELTTVIENNAVLSESDSAKLLEVFEIGTPVVIVFTMGDYRNTAVFTRFTSPDNAVKAFSTALVSGQVGLLSQESGEFTVFVQ